MVAAALADHRQRVAVPQLRHQLERHQRPAEARAEHHHIRHHPLHRARPEVPAAF
jgi:hypothetical protein